MTKRLTVLSACDFCGTEHPDDTGKVVTYTWTWMDQPMEFQACRKDKRKVHDLTLAELMEASHPAIPDTTMPTNGTKPRKKVPKAGKTYPTVEERMEVYRNHAGTYACPSFGTDNCESDDIPSARGLVSHHARIHKTRL